MSGCRACRSGELEVVADLGPVPASDRFPPATSLVDEASPQLVLVVCRKCLLVQLGPGALPATEEPVQVVSATAERHAAHSVNEFLALERIPSGASVRELDSGHGGSWLPAFRAAGLTPVADGRAFIVADIHHLMHEMDADAAVAGLVQKMDPNGVLVCEFLHLLPVVQHGLIDTVRHGHFLYWSLVAFENLLGRHGLRAVRATEVRAYGGSLRVVVRRAGEHAVPDSSVAALLARERSAGLHNPGVLSSFAQRGTAATAALRETLVRLRDMGEPVAGYGAPSKAPVLLALAGVDADLLPWTVDLSPAKTNRRIPGTQIEVCPVSRLFDERPEHVVVLTWDIWDEVREQLARQARGLAWNPLMHVPLPQLRAVPLLESL